MSMGVLSPPELDNINDVGRINLTLEMISNVSTLLDDMKYFNSKNITLIIDGESPEKYWKNSFAEEDDLARTELELSERADTCDEA